MVLLTISFFSISNQVAYSESEIIANSIGFENSTILELKNSRGNNVEINSVRIWLSEGNSFESFKTEKGWIGKNTPQGVIVFTTQDSLKPGEVVKFGIKTLDTKPVINWKALDSDGNIIQSAQTITDITQTNTSDFKGTSQSKSVAINDDSSFKLIPDKLSVGSDFRVLGNNFVPNQTLNFYINDKIAKTFSSDDDGNFLITYRIPDDIPSERTYFGISDSVGAEKEISIRLLDTEKRTIGQTFELEFDEIPTTVKRGETITLKGIATPETTVTITSSQTNAGILSIDTIITGFDGKWSFENLFSPDLDLETVTIKTSDGKTLIERNIEVISSKLITINANESRYEPGDVMSFTGTAIANNDLLVYLEDPKGVEVYSNLYTVDSSGIVNFDIPTELTQMKGTYILYSTQGKEDGISVVGIGEDPLEIIVVKASKLNHSNNENVIITIQGEPNARVSIIVLDDSSKEKISDTIELGVDGYHIYEIKSNEVSVGSYAVEVRHGKARGDTYFSVGLQQGSGVINMQTTKDEYSPGDGILLMGNTGANSILVLSIYNPDEVLIKQVELFSDKSGGFRSDKFRIPNDPVTGEWKIKAKSGGNTAESVFQVTDTLTGIIVNIDKESAIYSLTDILTISGAGASKSSEINIEFYDSQGNTIFEKLTIYATANGEYTTSIPVATVIPSDLVPSDFTIIVTDTNSSSSVIITVN